MNFKFLIIGRIILQMFKMFDEYIVNHDENRMYDEGDVALARRKYYSASNNNLFVLLQNR